MFGKIASLLTVLGVGLYFTGWIYRWAYFSYFQLEVTTLDLPFESFLIVPIQVFLGNISSGDISTILRTIKIAIATFIIIIISFKIIQFFTQELANIINQIISWLLRKTLKTKHHRINRTLLSFPNFQPVNDQKYDKVLINEIVIVTWLLTALFVLGQNQGKVDAIRDSRNETSSLPVVTLITPENKLPLGRKIDDTGDDPKVGSFRVIGDLELYEELLLQDYNDKTKPQPLQIIWRLLIDRDGQYYIFPSLPKNAPSNAHPPVVVIQQSDRGEYVVILSPEAAP
ncbi:MAG: hypothetical protein F6K54_06040 [Okeania sp. SIO3B5]|uniref:hypothetical protein n=1 Tax=Okeania sp. SIO3B5 TaxID=2607811 RepID=UPI0013FF5446|nr:hypothetical protein [Okeania sp. SIO3B5]NEO52674.1 hypothetical protein [Okeania sp. SIO3B5]